MTAIFVHSFIDTGDISVANNIIIWSIDLFESYHIAIYYDALSNHWNNILKCSTK